MIIFIYLKIPKLEESKIKRKYGILYQNFYLRGLRKFTIVIFHSRIYLSSFVLVFGRSFPLIQGGLFLGFSILSLIWNILLHPYRSYQMRNLLIISDGMFILINLLFFILMDNEIPIQNQKDLGMIIVFLMQFLIIIHLLPMLLSILNLGYERVKTLCKRVNTTKKYFNQDSQAITKKVMDNITLGRNQTKGELKNISSEQNLHPNPQIHEGQVTFLKSNERTSGLIGIKKLFHQK